MADAGIRSAELFPWVVPGGDLATDGWGTAAWNDRVHAALAAARRCGVRIDLLIAPETPAGVPSITADSPGAGEFDLSDRASLELPADGDRRKPGGKCQR
jgi:hypothetical protein